MRLEATRTDDIKVNGAVVALLRKHAKTAGIGTIGRNPETGDLWLPLFPAAALAQRTGCNWRKDTAGAPPDQKSKRPRTAQPEAAS